jgi:hypothetical protein
MEWQIVFGLNGTALLRGQRSPGAMIVRDKTLVSSSLLSESPRTHSRNLFLLLLEKSLDPSCRSSVIWSKGEIIETAKTVLADRDLPCLTPLDRHRDDIIGSKGPRSQQHIYKKAG